MPVYYRNEALFSEIYLEEITKQLNNADILASLNVLRDYHDFADGTTLDTWRKSFVHEVLSALGFNAVPSGQHLTRLIPMGSNKSDSPLSVCFTVLPTESLDNTTIGRNWAEKIIRALRENNLHWGLLTNGRMWRIYHLDEPTPYETYLEIDLESILKEKDKGAFQVFHKFMKSENYIPQEDGKCQFDRFKKESQDKIDYIEKELANALRQREEGGKGVLSDICMGYIKELRQRGEGDLDDESFRKVIYHAAMLYMFRLLFLFYADARKLLSDANHTELQAVLSVCQSLQSGKEKSTRVSMWDSLENIFVDIDQTYNGGLFSPQESEFTRFLSETRIADSYLTNALFNLTTYREKNGVEKPISYRDMGVRHLGTLYEGLLEHKLFIALEDTEVKVSKNKVQFIPASSGGRLVVGHYIKAGEVYFAGDPTERKSSGSYYTPEDVVVYIVLNTVGEKLKESKKALLLEESSNLGAYAVAVDEGERAALAALLEEHAMDFIRIKVLQLSVLDPAMGSGHFLVNATNLISNFLTELLNELGVEGNMESGTAHWRRWVVENCIYGVDIHPLAVELAKLSLWILSMAKDQPLSFLRHHLKCGNSLVGAKLADIGIYPFSAKNKETQQLSLFETDPDFKAAVETAISNSKKIASLSSELRNDVDQKKAWLDEMEEVLASYKAICDVHTELFFNTIKMDEDQYLLMVKNRDYSFTDQLDIDKHYLHWELEFPEHVFGTNGFDVVLGNPPYADFPGNFEFYFKYHYSSITSGDLYTLFIERLIDLTNKDGFGGFVLPLSLTFSENMLEIRKFIDSQNHRTWKISSFDRIPDALFGGNVRTRCSILLGSPNDQSKSELLMTPMFRWFVRNRSQLFSSIRYTNVDDIKEFHDGWPKIGSISQVRILKYLFDNNRNIGLMLSKTKTDFPLFFSSTAYNWLTITSKMPPVYDMQGNLLEQTKYGSIYFNNQDDAWFSLSILNSSFSYWYWLIYGDGFDVTRKLLASIPINSSYFNQNVYSDLVILGQIIQNEMESHLVFKVNAGKRIGNYNLRLCRDKTDKVDKLIFNESGLSQNDLSDLLVFIKSMIKTDLLEN